MLKRCLKNIYILEKYRHARVCQIIVCALILLPVLFQPVNALADHQSILIAYSEEKSFVKIIGEQLKTNLDGRDIHIKAEIINSNTDLSTEELSHYKLIVALGSTTTERILQQNIKTPMLSLLIPKQVISTLEKSSHPDQPWATLQLDQPMERQFLLIKHLLGKNMRIGTLLSPHSADIKEELNSASSKVSLKLNIQEVPDETHLIDTLEYLTTKTDVLLTIPDPITFNKKTIRGILLLTYRNGIPVIGFSKSYVKAGAIAAIYSEPEQISNQASAIINSYIRDGVFNSKIYYPEDYTILTNSMVARTLGIRLKPEKEIIDDIKNDELKQ